jgi:hypothetical protein
MDDKPKLNISWDDLNASSVDDRIKERQTISSTQKHFEQANVVSSQRQAGAMSWLLRSTIFLPLFGLLGGVLGWIASEALSLRPNAFAQAQDLIDQQTAIDRAEARGRFSKDDADKARASLARLAERNAYFAIHLDSTLTQTQRQERLAVARAADRSKDLRADTLFFGVCGALMALAMASAESIVDRNANAAVVRGAVGAVIGLVAGIAVALVSPSIEQFTGQLSGLSRQVVSRSITWGLLGLVVGLAPGIATMSLRRALIGMTGGLIGGLLGGAVFDPIATATSNLPLSRLVGIASIGGLAGLACGMLENAAKVGWLRVVEGLIAGKQFILYRNPTYVGSAAMSHVYLFRDPAVGRRHAAIHHVPGGFEIENLPLGEATTVNDRPVERLRLRNGDRIRIGRTVFVFEHREAKSNKRQ